MYGVLFSCRGFVQIGRGYGPLAAGLRLPWTTTRSVFAPIGGNLVAPLGVPR